MPETTFDWASLAPAIPEIYLAGAVCALLMIDVFFGQTRRGLTATLTLVVLAGGAALTAAYAQVSQPTLVFSGLYVADSLGYVLKLFGFLFVAVALLYSRSYMEERSLMRGEYFVLALTALLGVFVLVSANSLLTVYVGVELLALSVYAMVAFDRDSGVAAEAAMKYFVLGAIASGTLLYGMSMIYGMTGTLALDELAGAIDGSRGALSPGLILGLVFVVVAVAFKLGAVPFHMWLPDVYHGAPTSVTLFIGTAPKIAYFALTFRLLAQGLGGATAEWTQMLAILAVLTLVVGNLVAIAQTNLKRMLAYSTISHIGFLLLGLINGTPAGYAAATFYAITYAITTVAAFGMIVLLSRAGFEAEEIEDFRGLNQRNGWYAMIMLMVMASLAGVPVWVGFIAKFQVLKAAVDSGHLWLAICAGVFAVIGAFYYLRVIKVMYFDEPATAEPLALPNDMPFRFVLSANGLGLLALGVLGGPLMAWCLEAVTR